MAAVVVALEAYALIEQVNTIYTSARDRVEKACRNPALAQELAELFKRLQTEIAPLVAQCRTNDVKFLDHHLAVFNLRICELKTTMTSVQANLEEKIVKLNNPVYRFARARAMNDWLLDIKTIVREADQLVFHITACFANAILIDRVIDAVGTTKKFSDDQQDEFRPSFEIMENPPHVVLNFGSVLDFDEGNHMSLTVEAKLKRAVLRSDGSRSVVAVGSSLGVTGATGMSGVGKSCTLRGLAKDVDVCGRFPDGIYFIVLGKDATEADVMRRISRIMMISGSRHMAREVRQGEDIDEAVSKAGVWFRGKCILLEIDDVWDASDNLRGIVGKLARIADMEYGSRVVFSTRDNRVLTGSEVIHFGKRGDEASREILLSAAGLEDADVAECGEIVDEVLGYCGGIPMALAVAGSAVKRRLAPTCTDSSMVANVLHEYAAGLQRCRQRLVRALVPNDPYNNLESAFRASLEMLEKSQEQRLGFRCKMSVLEMYRALVVMRRQGWIPVRVLIGLWNITDMSEAIDVMQELVETSLARREDRIVNGETVPGITLHDMQLYFVEAEATKHGEVKMLHRAVLCVWSGEQEGSSSSGGLAGSRNWCRDDVLEDEHVRNNVCRHLICGGLQDELYLVLRNPKWAARRVCCGEVVSLEEDIRMLVEFMEGKEKKSTGVGSEIWSLKMIAGAARLSAPYVSRNKDEVWFQFYGRLFRHAERSEIMRSFIAEVEKCAQKPWLKAVMGCLVDPGGALQSKMLCEGHVHCLSEMDGEGKLVVCGIRNGRDAFVSTFVSEQEERTVWLSNGDASFHDNMACAGEDGYSASGNISPRKSSKANSMHCTSEGNYVVIGYEDGRLQIWEAKTGKAVGVALIGHSGTVACVAWSPDGKRIASGGRDGKVRLWDVEKGEALGEALVGPSNTVACVAWSPDGKRLASAGDGRVLVWEVEKEAVLSETLFGHSHAVVSLAWSHDGNRIASGGLDGRVNVWDVKWGEAVSLSMVGRSGWISCIAWSPDDGRIASGGLEKEVRVWDVERREAIGEALVGHHHWVECVGWSPDGKRIASGGDEGVVCMWDVEKGEAVGEAPAGHSDWIEHVTWSPDGRRIASREHNGTMRFWEVDLEKCVPAKDGWAVGDLSHVNSWVHKEIVNSGDKGDVILRVDHESFVYSSGGKETVLGTLEDMCCWEYSGVSRMIAVGRRNGAVSVLHLVE